jgi:trigger factor
MHEIRKPAMPELNDEFAKSVGQESIAKLREHIETILKDQYENASKQFMKDELLDALSEKKMELPESLVEKEIEISREEYKRQHEGHDHESKFDEKAARKDAEKRVKLGLILAEWGNNEKVDVTQAEVQQALFNEAYRSGMNPQDVFNYYNENKGALQMLRGVLFESKVIDAMLTKVNKKDKKVKADELFKQK